MVKGRRRWVERMRAAKARGEIARFPGGRRARGLPPLSKDPTIRRAQKIVEKLMALQDIAPVRKLPWEELSHSDKLDKGTGLALDIAAKILNDGAMILERDGLEGTDIKLVTLVKDTALQVISNQIRVDTAALQAQALSTAGLSDEQKRERARRMILEAFAERAPPRNAEAIEHEPLPTEDGISE
jgi:hypothetical protein